MDGTKLTRTRSYEWHDPRTVTNAITDRTGADLLTAIRDGELPPPPISVTLGLRLVEVGEGRAVFELVPQEWHYNQTGGAHGSVHAAMLDSAMGAAVQSVLPACVSYTTLDLSVRYLRPVRVESGMLRCEGEIISQGSRIVTARGAIMNAKGQLLATGSAGCLVTQGTPRP